jgi:hypothetical protein
MGYASTGFPLGRIKLFLILFILLPSETENINYTSFNGQTIILYFSGKTGKPEIVAVPSSSISCNDARSGSKAEDPLARGNTQDA